MPRRAGLLSSPGVGALNPSSPEYLFLIGYGCATLFNPYFAKLSHAQSLSESKVSGTVKLSYRFDKDVMAYVSYASGYKAGGFNLSRVTNPAAPNPLLPVLDISFPEETVDSYEIGLKSRLANNTLRLNASVFDQKYRNFQLNTYTGILFVVSSVARVQSKGAEVALDWAAPLRGLSFSGGLTYAFTNIDEFGDSFPLFSPLRLNDRLSFAPLWSGVVSAAYEVPISGTLSLRTSVSEKYSSSYNTGSDLNPEKLQRPYGLLDARIGVGARDEKWVLEFWGHNVTDKGYYQVAFDAPFQYHQIDAFLGDPRTFGVTLRGKF